MQVRGLQKEIIRKDTALAELVALLTLEKVGFPICSGREGLNSIELRSKILTWIDAAVSAGAHINLVCETCRVTLRVKKGSTSTPRKQDAT